MIAEGAEEQLEALALDDRLGGRIVDHQMREVGLAGHRAQGRELRRGEAHEIERARRAGSAHSRASPRPGKRAAAWPCRGASSPSRGHLAGVSTSRLSFRRWTTSSRLPGSPRTSARRTSRRRFKLAHAGDRRSGRQEYLQSHIPGARFLDIDAVADTAQPRAAHAAERRGIRRGDARTGRRPRRPHRRLRQQPDTEPPRAAGSCFAISAPSRSRSSTAASRNGWRKAGRRKAASPARVRRSFEPSSEPAGGRASARWRPASARR